MAICSANHCNRTEPCGPYCRDRGNFDKKPLVSPSPPPLTDLQARAEAAADAVRELADMLDLVTPEQGTVVFDHTPEEIGLHVMENYQAIRAALFAPISDALQSEGWRPILPPASVGGDYLEGWCDGQTCLIDAYSPAPPEEVSETHIQRVQRIAASTRSFFEQGLPDIEPGLIERIAMIGADMMAAELTGETLAASRPAPLVRSDTHG